MLEGIVKTLQDNPALAIYLAIAIGYWIGNIRVGSFNLGSVTGVLLAGLSIGQLSISISPDVKSVFFLMFLFAVGYGVGPQFVRGIATDGLPQAIFAVVISIICLLSVFACSLIGGFTGEQLGFGAGLLSGTQTISASIGLATNAINNLGLTADQVQALLDQIPVAYAVTYIWGTVGTGMIIVYLGPILIGTNIEEACKDYEAQMGGKPGQDFKSAWHQLEIRAYQIDENSQVVGKTVAEAEQLHPEERIFIERIQQGNGFIDADPTTIIQAGDIIAVSGPTQVLVDSIEQTATEVAGRDLLSIPVESVDVVVTRKSLSGRTIEDLAQRDFARGVYLNDIVRGAAGVSIPILPKTTIHRGDILKIAGTRRHTDRLIKEIGYPDRPSQIADMVFVGLGIVIGGIFGAITLPVAGVPLTMSTSGGALIAGLIVGWLRGVHPTFGRIPGPTLWFMNNVGLNMFIAVVGISSGPGFVSGLKSSGVQLFLLGIVATSIPMILAPLIGKYIFKFHPAINLGCCGGARTSTASVGMVAEAAQSQIPMLGYTVPYAVSNTLLTLWGLVIVLMLPKG
ncbi:aspartate-alanine antiporter [Rubidibacter lacunae KORDI 51-2]|uniref:Aspartate-alanine antiporter n=1 Tax=Rubidibacter lacunae KORDI 51-2 TaxID=582515 RepID=U5DGN3_9CHRO|nr:aspartate-alanine antiporter [Rubidibacter lacunae]ERN40442.1 aspartate-alanine antiporter [Rubidibacter lacunae KORDI 51-2]